MSSVTFSTSVGGDGSTVTDDSNPTTGLAAGGHRTRFVPSLAQVVAVAGHVVSTAGSGTASAAAAAASAAAAAASQLDIHTNWQAKLDAADASATAAAGSATAAAGSATAAAGSATAASGSAVAADASADAAALSETAAEAAAATVSAAVDGVKDLYVAGTDYTKNVSTSVTLTAAPNKPNTVKVFFNGVYQNKDTYYLVGSTINFGVVGTPAVIDADSVEVQYEIPSQFVGLSPAEQAVLTAAQSNALASANAADASAIDAEASANAMKLADYAALRTYSGTQTSVYVTSSGIAGHFIYDGLTTGVAEDNGGTVICAASVGAKRWKRVFDGAVSVKWFGAVGDGVVDDSPYIGVALLAASLGNLQLFFPAGNYLATTLVRAVPVGNVSIFGAGQLSRVTGNGQVFCLLAEGMSSELKDITFDSWAAVVEVSSNVAAQAYGTLEAENCTFINIYNSPFWNYSGSVEQGVEVVRFNKNTVTGGGKINGSSAGLGCRSDYVRSAFVTDNEIEDIGGNFSGKKYGIIIGALSLGSDTSTYIAGNRVRTVKNNSIDEINGIIAFGTSTRVIGNSVQEVDSTDVNNADCEGLYVKASYSVISENSLINAGGSEGCLVLKGAAPDETGSSFGHDNIISLNSILITGTRVRRKGINILPVDRIKVFGNRLKGCSTGIGVSQGNELIEIENNTFTELDDPNTANTVTGISIGSVTKLSVKNNIFHTLGSGANANAIAISNSGPAATSYDYLCIEGNIINGLFATTSRGIRLSFNAGDSGKILRVCNNTVINSANAIEFTNLHLFASVIVKNNDQKDVTNTMNLPTPVPSAVDVAGNTYNGLPYISVAQSSTNMSVGMFDEARLSAVSPVTISAFTRMSDGRRIRLVLSGANITISHNANIKLAGAVSWNPASGGLIEFVNISGVSYETSRVVF